MKKLTVTLSDDMYDLLTFLQGQSEENNSQSKTVARCILSAANTLINGKKKYFFSCKECICIGTEKSDFWCDYELRTGRLRWNNHCGH